MGRPANKRSGGMYNVVRPSLPKSGAGVGIGVKTKKRKWLTSLLF